MNRFSLLVLVFVVSFACTAPLPPFDDAGPDGGGTSDAGRSADAGDASQVDDDAGVDSGAVDDGGVDSGAVGDGGVDGGLDAAPADAGSDAGPPPVRVVDLALGSDHTCGLLETGLVYCWGGDDRGELGDGATDESVAHNRPEPMAVVDLSNVASIQASWDVTCAIDATDRSAQCWGYNSPNRFGDGIGASVTPRPDAVIFPATPEAVLGVSQVASHLCLYTPGNVYCAGYNGSFQLGRTGASSPFLSAVVGLPFGRTPRSVAVGYSGSQGFSLVALDDGSVWCWGANDHSECGLPESSEVATPTQISGLSRIVEVAAGSDFACARDDVGAVFCWGDNSNGTIGNGTEGGIVATPTELTTLPAIGALALNGWTAVATSADRTAVYGWGYNSSDQLGLGPTAADVQPTPQPLVVDASSTFQAETSGSHTCYVRRRAGMDDVILCAGSNRHFQLGVRVAADPTRFAVVPLFP